MILADKIILERKKNGWSQEELADKLNVTRQAVSKWEGAQTTPDLQRILEMSRLFGVTADYLIKDEIDAPEEYIEEVTDTPGIRMVSMDEANDFLALNQKTTPKIALGVSLCIISPICMFLLAVCAELHMIPLSEDAAGGIGMIVLLAIVAIACSIFIDCNIKTSPYKFLEKEIIETAYGVTGMVNEKKKQYEPTYIRFNIIGTVLCLMGAMALFCIAILDNGDNSDDFVAVVFLCLMFIIVSIGVNFFVLAGNTQAGFEKLLQKGGYSIKEKTKSPLAASVSGVYWLIVTAVFLTFGFTTNDWKTCGFIFPVAGVLFPVVLIIAKAFEK